MLEIDKKLQKLGIAFKQLSQIPVSGQRPLIISPGFRNRASNLLQRFSPGLRPQKIGTFLKKESGGVRELPNATELLEKNLDFPVRRSVFVILRSSLMMSNRDNAVISRTTLYLPRMISADCQGIRASPGYSGSLRPCNHWRNSPGIRARLERTTLFSPRLYRMLQSSTASGWR
ncbi:uncharacterized protein BT62DRAFT_443349 [Guyanagaster necrorhizus]|uniref:Uncharacterized protein n=1 Tax=Guyanagaster necrorhizus TaxID=856835 RepID=A0A9P7VKL7_9AGAR|nr:uncharacterized protein BT62DRAFT_443349 [Guyanagaster necrorhizus MCA 3950]KAG7442285.1 hypothetical protein BT62DRAFT_443349 [Guyanagaster necrorhizus MCA 3950]